MYISQIISNSRKIQKELIFNQYLEIGGRLQPNFANFNLDFLSKYEFQTLEIVHPLISKYRQAASYFEPACMYLENRRKYTYSSRV